MHQSNYTPANGAGMQHQPSFNPVPQSQQQQSSGQSNHNQQTTGAQQRHHPSYQSYPAQVRPQQPGSAHPNQQGQRIMQYNQGTNPHTGTTNYIPGSVRQTNLNMNYQTDFSSRDQVVLQQVRYPRPHYPQNMAPSVLYFQPQYPSTQANMYSQQFYQHLINQQAPYSHSNANFTNNWSVDHKTDQYATNNIFHGEGPNSRKTRPNAIPIKDPETNREIVPTIGNDDSSAECKTEAEKMEPNITKPRILPSKAEEDPAKQTIIAEFQSKVIQAQAEGNETESTLKKKAQGESTNVGENMSDNRKKSIDLTNQEDKAKVDPQSKNAVIDTIETEATAMNNKPLASDEPINVPNSKKAATEKSSSVTKSAGDISQSENKLDAVSEGIQEKPNIQSVVKESFSNKVTSTEKSSSNSEHRSGLSTPSQRSKQVPELEPISPTPLPETPSSGATSSVGTSSKSNLLQKRSGTLNLEVRTVGPKFAFESKEKQNSEFKPNSEARHKQLRSEKLPLTYSASCSKSKTSSISNQVDSAIYPTNKEVKMNEDNDEGWEVAVGGKKKSKSKSKQVSSNNTNLHQNGINLNTQKSQVKDSYGGHKVNQRKVSAPTPNSTITHRKQLDKRDKTRPAPNKQKHSVSQSSNSSLNSSSQKYTSEVIISSNGTDDSLAIQNTLISSTYIQTSEKPNLPAPSNGHETPRIQSASISDMISDADKELSDNLGNNSVINEPHDDKKSINGLDEFRKVTNNNLTLSNESCDVHCIGSNSIQGKNTPEQLENELNYALKSSQLDENLNYDKEESTFQLSDNLLTSSNIPFQDTSEPTKDFQTSKEVHTPIISEEKQIQKPIQAEISLPKMDVDDAEKAKQEVGNDKTTGKSLDVNQDRNSGVALSSTANQLPSKDLSNTNAASDNTSFSDDSERAQTVESQIKDSERTANISPSIVKHSDEINDAKLEAKSAIDDAVVELENNKNDVSINDQNAEQIIENTINCSTDGIELPVVENGILEKGPTLKYEYKPDQWSPINIEGKKQYDREFLMKLQQDPLSMTKPDNLPNMDIIKDKAIAKISSGIPGSDKFTPNFTPSFVKPTISNRGPPQRGASRGKKDQRPGQQVSGQHQRVLVLPEVNKPVVLHEAENAWKPKKFDENGEESDMAILERKARAILNKLTPQKFDKLVLQFKELDIDSAEKLEMGMELVFEKALDEPEFSVAYAKMCEVLKDKAPSTQSEEDPKKALNFKRILIAKCQREFYRDYMEDLNKDKYESDLAAAESEDKRKEIQSEWEEQERRARKRSLGNIRFIGELYKLKMLTVRIMHECVNKLLIPNHAESLEAREESLECLCKLLTTVGKDLDEETSRKITETSKGSQPKPQDGIKKLDVYFTEMANVVESKQTSSRIRFRIQDLIDLRRRRWVPRRESDGPKKIDAIHADIAREKTLQQLHDHNVGNIGGGLGSRDGSKSIGRDRDGRGNVGDPRKRSSRGPQGPVGVPTDHEGWNTVPSRPPTKVQEKFDPSKISGLTVMHKKDPDTALGMRPMSMSSFSAWGKGSGGSNRMSQSKEDRNSPMPRNQNRFSSLYNPPGERSVSPSAQPLSNNFERQGSSGSQSPTSTLERQHRGGSGGSRSMGPIVRDFRGPNRGATDTTNERDGTLHGQYMHTHMSGNNGGSFMPSNFAKMSSNGPPGVASISRTPSNIPSVCSQIGPTEDEIKKGQQRMQGQQARKSDVDLERCINNVLEEYLNSCDDKEVESTIRESFIADMMPQCVETWLNHAMEHRDNKMRTTLGKLLIYLVNQRLLQREQCLIGFSKFLPIAIDLLCDIPKIWDYIGEVVATMLEKSVFTMEFLNKTADFIRQSEVPAELTCQEIGKYVEAVLKLLSQKVGKEEVGKMWNQANLRWDMFLPSSDIKKFVAERNLGFTLNDKQPIDQLADNLRRLLRNSKPSDNNEIINNIDQYLANVGRSQKGEPTYDNEFIRTLTTAVAESTITGIGNQETPNNLTLETEAMQHRAVILKKYLDAKVERETQALFALQTLVHKLEHPNKLLHQIFECLYQADVITYEGFEQWEQSKDPAEQEGKGVAIKSTTQFFTWLREVDPDEET